MTKLVAIFSLVGLAAACDAAPVDELLANKACKPDGACAEGYHCVSGICEPGAGGAPSAGGSGGSGATGATGGSGGAGASEGGGGSSGCDSITDCPPPVTPCEQPICLSGECGILAVPGGEVLPNAEQQSGDCKTKKCDGLGNVVEENDDLDLPDDSLECTLDVCISGVGGHRVSPVGTACNQAGGSFCDAVGDCVQCAAESDCSSLPTADFCQQRACEAGACVQVFTAINTALPAQTAGDCQVTACDGLGGTVQMDDDSDAPNDGSDCTTDSCVGGAPDFDPLPAGTTCSAGTCNATGQCTGCTQPSDCAGTDTFCRQRTCVASLCGFSYTNAGTALPPADQAVGDCQSLTCDGAGGVQSVIADTDVPLDDGLQCTGQTCQGGTPQFPPVALDVSCNEGGGIVCNGAGACVACNSPVQCSAQGSVCEDATCVSNSCGLAPKALNAPAEAGAQTLGDCKIVRCDGTGQPLPPSNNDSDLPVDGNLCTNDVCTNGTPSNPPAMQGTPCGGGGECNSGGVCAGATKADGEQCVLGSECDSGSCVDGVCCETACSSLCSACTAAKTGGSDGDCDPIPVGQDPDVECSVTQTCSGSGACSFTCGQEPAPPGGACPAVCNGGCSNGTCIIACNTPDACEAATLNCPAGFACTVECGANDGCKDTIINCPSRYACNVACSNDCQNATINCGTGTCDLTCGAGTACQGVDLVCANNSCSATCSGTSNLPAVACGSACDCDPCGLSNGQACTNSNQCQSSLCPPQDDVCCSSTCTGLCRSCVGTSTGGASGTCGFVSAGLDPNNECPGPQTCNGNGACQP